MSQIHVRARRDGFTLIEVIVAMVLMAVAMTMLASFSMGTATELVKLSQSDIRQAVTLREINRLAALPYASLPAENGLCRSITVAGLVHQSCVTVTNGTGMRTVQVIVTPPAGLASTFADTMVLQRVGQASNPLNMQ